jgi:hypothetical protein
MKQIVLLLLLSLLVLPGCVLLGPSLPSGQPTALPGAYQTLIIQTLTALAPTVPVSTGTPTAEALTPVPPSATAVTASHTPLPSATSAPAQTPDQFVRYYYANINIANYPLTWSLLSDHFKSVMNGAGLGGYQGYVRFWNTVHEVRVQSVTVVSTCSSTCVVVRVVALYHYNSGVLATESDLFALTYDSTRKTWLFDSSFANTPTPSATATRTSTRTATATLTRTPSTTATNSATPSPTASATITPTGSATPSPTSSETPSATPTDTPVTPTETPTPTST